MLVNKKAYASNLISITCQGSRNPPDHTVTSALEVINHQLPYISRIVEKKQVGATCEAHIQRGDNLKVG